MAKKEKEKKDRDDKKKGLYAKEIKKGMKVELEHGKRSPRTNITNDDPVKTRKIAKAHLEELPDYYDRLDDMEKQGKKALKNR
jgi:hypothetical protein